MRPARSTRREMDEGRVEPFQAYDNLLRVQTVKGEMPSKLLLLLHKTKISVK